MDSNTKENYNFAIKMISTENVVKNVKEVTRKNQTFLFQVSNLGDQFKNYLLRKIITFLKF